MRRGTGGFEGSDSEDLGEEGELEQEEMDSDEEEKQSEAKSEKAEEQPEGTEQQAPPQDEDPKKLPVPANLAQGTAAQQLNMQ